MKLLMIGFKLAFSHFTFHRARSHFLFPVLVNLVPRFSPTRPTERVGENPGNEVAF